MLFIVLLSLAAFALAGAAEFFSVWGLAHTFSGVFWSVVIMGAALGGGKLMGVSYLYRYWKETHWTLKGYLFSGIAVLMLLTSGGIFGYLSSGYQQDVLPLAQKNAQVKILSEERDRILARKKQIDDALSGGPSVNTAKSDGATARVLREATKAKESTAKQYRDEQQQVNKRIGELDTQLLTIKQDLIQSEAHVGPIIYIAKAFDLPTDDATKYLIFLIIFAFDPMAIALTLCVNIALKLREEQMSAPAQPRDDTPKATGLPEVTLPYINLEDLEPSGPVNVSESKFVVPTPQYDFSELPQFQPAVDPAPATYDFSELPQFQPVVEPESPSYDFSELPQFQPVVEVEPIIHHDEDEPPEIVEAPQEEPVEEPMIEELPDLQAEIPPAVRRTRVYPGMWSSNAPPAEKVQELIAHYKVLSAKQQSGSEMTKDDIWEMSQIEQVLRRHGLDIYLHG